MLDVTALVYTETYAESVERAVAYLAQNTGLDKAVDTVWSVQERFEARVLNSHVSCQMCSELVDLGVPDYREYHIDNYRVLYSFDEKSEQVKAICFMRQNQSIRKLVQDLTIVGAMV